MSKYLFKTKCPACEDEEIKTWCHNSEKCGGAYYIDEDLYLHCNKCNDKTFLFNIRFNCGKHDHRKPSMFYVMEALTFLNTSSDIPDGILKKILNKAIDYIEINSQFIKIIK